MPKLNQVDPPKDERSVGEVTFNYTSYDGRFVIGSEMWAFEMRWSTAGQGSAHLSNDPAGIEGVAIAEGVTKIGQVTPDIAAAADFTSRVRTPHVGQVALLRNTAGFYAAVEPLEINRSSSPSNNLMRLRFAIQTDRSTDFTAFASTFDDRQARVDQLLTAAANAERALRAVPADEDIAIPAIAGIGHNQPPAEFAITQHDQAEALAAIATVREEAVKSVPSSTKLRAAGHTIARVASQIAKYVAGKLDTAAEEFAKAVGKAAGNAVVVLSVGAWLDVQSTFAALMDSLGKLFV